MDLKKISSSCMKAIVSNMNKLILPNSGEVTGRPPHFCSGGRSLFIFSSCVTCGTQGFNWQARGIASVGSSAANGASIHEWIKLTFLHQLLEINTKTANQTKTTRQYSPQCNCLDPTGLFKWEIQYLYFKSFQLPWLLNENENLEALGVLKA